MSEVEPTSPAPDTAETAEGVDTDTPAPATPSSPYPLMPSSVLTQESDQAVRPGFRSPANKGSKAQRSAKKKR